MKPIDFTEAQMNEEEDEAVHQRFSLLQKLEDLMEVPLLVLSFVWLLLMIMEFTGGLSLFEERINYFIWALFIFDYFLKFVLAPRKREYVQSNLLTAASLVLPAIRIFRFARVLRGLSSATRGLRLARVLASINRGMGALGKSLKRRGFGYVVALTCLVALAGAAGMHSFESETLPSYGAALWWTAMILTTMGSDTFPSTAEGRFLCLALAIYGFAVFGYVTATVATYFVGREAADRSSDVAGQASIEELREEIFNLRRALEVLVQEQRVKD